MPRFLPTDSESRAIWGRTVLVCVLSLGYVPLQAHSPSAPDPARITMSYQARLVAPGEVVRIRVESSVPIDMIDSRSPAGPVYFSQSSIPTVWEAFAGLDLGVKPGAYPITIRVSAGGAAVEESLRLTVLPKRFPARRISVDERFARPPASALARIKREAKEIAAVLAVVSVPRRWDGAFMMPVPGRMTSPFGRLSIVNGAAQSPHVGTDLAAAVGTPVKAPAAGRVVLSANLYYAGEAVMVDHGLGVYSLLAHLSGRDVQVGDVVEAGQRLGLSGATGRITGPHLHWTVRVAGARVDPLSIVKVSGREGQDDPAVW